MANNVVFTKEEMLIDDGLGYPRAYAKLCRDRNFGPFTHGPPFTFTPYALVHQEDLRAKELDEMFPIIDIKAKPTTRPKIFLSLLWKQLNHLGNAGFDPDMFRVDSYGNVLYFHADSASPLAWDIDHWFPCSRGGLTVPSNLRILQWQVCRKKYDKLEFLIPWWDFQVGISINQFLSIFASSNSDFRRRAFSWLFSEGESEELNALQAVDSHTFPQHFIESKAKIGLAPAAIVLSRRESIDAPLKSLDVNRRPRSSNQIIAAKKMKQLSKENEDPLMTSNPYQAIVMARDSLKQREDTLKMKAEIQRLDNEVEELHYKTEEEKVPIQDLEMVLVKKRRRAEKCRQVAESQCSYRAMLEKMIRDAMHQSVVYKEQVRLNQAAASALYARLEAQKAICDSAERELHRKYKQRDELEKQIRPEWEKARKRSRMDDTTMYEEDNNDNLAVLCLPENEQKTQKNDTLPENKKKENIMYSPEIQSSTRLHKELRKFLEENQELSQEEEPSEGCREITNIRVLKPNMDCKNKAIVAEDGYIIEERLENLELQNGESLCNMVFPFPNELKIEEDEESRKQRGKGNIEKWMQFLLEATPEDEAESNPPRTEKKVTSKSDEFLEALDLIYPHSYIRTSSNAENVKEVEKIDTQNISTPFKNPPYRIEPEITKANGSLSVSKGARRVSNCNESVKEEKIGKEKELKRSESARAFRRIPSSPSLILEGMKKRVECIRKKKLVLDDGDESSHAGRNNFIKSSFKTMKRAVGI